MFFISFKQEQNTVEQIVLSMLCLGSYTWYKSFISPQSTVSTRYTGRGRTVCTHTQQSLGVDHSVVEIGTDVDQVAFDTGIWSNSVQFLRLCTYV